MALPQAAKDKIKSYGFDVDKLIEAIKAEAETDYDVPDFIAISQSDLEARDANNRAEGEKEGSKKGEAGTMPTLKKELEKKLGFDLRGDRMGDWASQIQQRMSQSDNDKVSELNTQISLLKQKNEGLEREKSDAERTAKQARFDNELITYFPTNRSADLTDAERLQLVKMNLSFEELDGKTVVKRNGEIVRDPKSTTPLAPKDVIASLFTEKNWISQAGAPGAQPTPQGGRGGSDNPPPPGGSGSGIKTYSQFEADWKTRNPSGNTMSPEFTNDVTAHAKGIPDFDYHS